MGLEKVAIKNERPAVNSAVIAARPTDGGPEDPSPTEDRMESNAAEQDR